MSSPLYVVLADKNEAYGPFYKPEEATSVCKSYGGHIETSPKGCPVTPPHRMGKSPNFQGVLHPKEQHLPTVPSKKVEAEVVQDAPIQTDMAAPLSSEERALLAHHEQVIQDGLNNALKSLYFIHDHNLYRERGTWAEYCAHFRDGISRQHGSRLVKFMEIVSETPAGIEPPRKESYARELAVLKDPGARQLAQLAADALVKDHPEWGMEHPNAMIYKGAVEVIKDLDETGVVDIDEQQAKPLDKTPALLASVLVHAAEVIQRHLNHKAENAKYEKADSFEGRMGNSADWMLKMLLKHGSDTEVRIVIFTKKDEPDNG